MVTRREDWPARLSAYLQARRLMPFAWGSNDCMLFAADAVLAMTDTDPAARWRGYKTREEAEEIMHLAGGPDALLTEALGVAGVRPVLLAGRGDIVTMKLDGGVTVGVVDDTGERIASVGEQGIMRLPLQRGWRVWRY